MVADLGNSIVSNVYGAKNMGPFWNRLYSEVNLCGGYIEIHALLPFEHAPAQMARVVAGRTRNRNRENGARGLGRLRDTVYAPRAR